MIAIMDKARQLREEQGLPLWEVRVGINTGPITAGVVGKDKFAYDIWGDTVNTASRMESGGQSGRLNVSESTHALVKDFFICESRGEIQTRGKGKLKMYFVDRLRPRYSADEAGRVPNEKFKRAYAAFR